MIDIVDLLRRNPRGVMFELEHQCADEITRLRAELAEVRRDAERLRDGLKWYADGNHCNSLNESTTLDKSWELEEGWLCAPDGEAWVVEPGNVAKAILNGGTMSTDNDSDELVVMP